MVMFNLLVCTDAEDETIEEEMEMEIGLWLAVYFWCIEAHWFCEGPLESMDLPTDSAMVVDTAQVPLSCKFKLYWLVISLTSKIS